MPQETFVGQRNAIVPSTPGFHTVYHVATGKGITVWPVDARELVASGEYSATPPADGTTPPVTVPNSIRDAVENGARVEAMQNEQPGASSSASSTKRSKSA